MSSPLLRRRGALLDLGVAYVDEVLADSPVLFLPLQDASGSVADALVGVDGTYVGTPTLQVPGPGSSLAYGVETDGGTDYISHAAVAALGYDQAQTWELWIDAGAGISSASAEKILVGQEYSGNQRWISSGNTAWGGLTNEVFSVATANSGGTNRTGWSGFTVPAGWNHVAFIYAGGMTPNVWSCFLNGVNVTDPAIGGTKIWVSPGSYGLIETQAFNIGAHRNTVAPHNWDGLAGFAVYDYAVSAARLAAHVAAA